LAGLLLVALISTGCTSGLRSNGILYIGWDERGHNQIYRLDQPADPARALTTLDPDRPGDVADFALSPDGEMVAYSLLYDDGGSAIWGVSPRGGDATLLLDCPDAECTGLSWAADSRRVAYERRLRDGGAIASPHLFWLDTRTGETLPLVEGDVYPSYGARFAPSGDWLGYVSLPDEGVVVYRESDGQQANLASYTGMPPAWSPDGGRLIISDLSLEVIHGEEGDDHTSHSHDYATAVHLFVIDDPLGEERRQLSPPGPVDDSAPAWSPSGEWVAFGRRHPDTASGRQLWLVREDGRDARALTDDQSIHHGPPSWSADGERLLYQRVAAFEPAARPSIWVMDVGSSEQEQLVAEGFQPVWFGR
jgi:TolB protein